MKKAVIFDFDGTIADTFRVALDIFYDLTGRGEIPHGEVDKLRSLSLLKAAKALKIPFWKAPLLLSRGRKQLASRIEHVELFDGIPEVLNQLHEEGYELHIISLNSEANIRTLLAMHGLEDVFTSIHGKTRLRSKAHIIKQLMKDFDLKPANIAYVGDEIRDIHAAHKAGVKVASVTWGYNNLHILHQTEPDELVMLPGDLLTALKRLIG